MVGGGTTPPASSIASDGVEPQWGSQRTHGGHLQPLPWGQDPVLLLV